MLSGRGSTQLERVRLPKNYNSYARDEQGVNPGQVRRFDGVLYKLTVADALISSVKVSVALTWEPKQTDVTKSPGLRCRSVNQVAGAERQTGGAGTE